MTIKDKLKLNIFESALADGIKSGLVALCENADTLEELDEVNATFDTMSRAITEASDDDDDDDDEDTDSKEKNDEDSEDDIPEDEEPNKEDKGDKDVREKIKNLKDKLKKQ